MRIGLVGAGAVVRTLHAPLLKQFADVSVQWVYDQRLHAAREIAEAFGIPAASDDLSRCADVDAVLIAIPVGAREQAWARAADRGWHVLCEKPAARTTAELDSILRRMEEAGRVVAFALMRRFYDGTMTLRDLIAVRAFGDPLEIWAGEGSTQPRTGRGGDWYQLNKTLSGGGVLIETGSHLLDQMMIVSGATGCRLENYAQRAWTDGLEFDARAAGQLRVAGKELPFSAVVSRSVDVCNGLFVRYPRIVLSLPPGPAAEVELLEERHRAIGRVRGAGARTSFQAFRDEWRDFLRRCRDDAKPHATRDNEMVRLSVALIDDCYSWATAASPAVTCK